MDPTTEEGPGYDPEESADIQSSTGSCRTGKRALYSEGEIILFGIAQVNLFFN